jgi:hypothetical protein
VRAGFVVVVASLAASCSEARTTAAPAEADTRPSCDQARYLDPCDVEGFECPDPCTGSGPYSDLRCLDGKWTYEPNGNCNPPGWFNRDTGTDYDSPMTPEAETSSETTDALPDKDASSETADGPIEADALSDAVDASPEADASSETTEASIAATELGTVPRPRGIAIGAGHAFVTSFDGAIYKLPIAGGAPTKIASAAWPTYVAVDATHVYWTDLGTPDVAGGIGRVPLAGGMQEVLAGPLAHANSTTLLAGNIYFAQSASTPGTTGSVHSFPSPAEPSRRSLKNNPTRITSLSTRRMCVGPRSRRSSVAKTPSSRRSSPSRRAFDISCSMRPPPITSSTAGCVA